MWLEPALARLCCGGGLGERTKEKRGRAQPTEKERGRREGTAFCSCCNSLQASLPPPPSHSLPPLSAKSPLVFFFFFEAPSFSGPAVEKGGALFAFSFPSLDLPPFSSPSSPVQKWRRGLQQRERGREKEGDYVNEPPLLFLFSFFCPLCGVFCRSRSPFVFSSSSFFLELEGRRGAEWAPLLREVLLCPAVLAISARSETIFRGKNSHIS